MYQPKTTRQQVAWFVASVALLLAIICAASAQANTVATCTLQADGSVLCCEVQPDGTPLCTSSVQTTLTPFVPTSTPQPTATATATIVIVPLRPHRSFLPVIR